MNFRLFLVYLRQFLHSNTLIVFQMLLLLRSFPSHCTNRRISIKDCAARIQERRCGGIRGGGPATAATVVATGTHGHHLGERGYSHLHSHKHIGQKAHDQPCADNLAVQDSQQVGGGSAVECTWKKMMK